MDEGWIKLARTFETDGHLDRMTDQALRLYVHFRLAAQWCPGRGLQAGQLRTSYRKLRAKTGYAMKTISKALTYLRDAGFITTEQYDAGGPLMVTVCEPGSDEPASSGETPASLSEAPAFPSEAPVSVSEAGAFLSETPVEGGASLSEAGVLPSVKQGASPGEAPTEPEPLSQKGSGDPQEGNKNGIHKKDTLVPQSDKPPVKERKGSPSPKSEADEEKRKLNSTAQPIVAQIDTWLKLQKKTGIPSGRPWAKEVTHVADALRSGIPVEDLEKALDWGFAHWRWKAKLLSHRAQYIKALWGEWSTETAGALKKPQTASKGYQPHYAAKVETPAPSGFIRKERQAT